MTTAIKRRRGTTTQHSTFTGLEAELTVDTTKKTVVVHDGATAGGFPLAKESQATTNVAITGGTISGITDLAVADGGTGASTAADARTNLGVTATGADTTYAYRANNLSDLASASTARTNLGLGTAATVADSSLVHIAGTETITGAKTFSTAPAVAGLSNSGNLTFTGTGNRITGDFSNGTIANQVAFQSSTTNGNTRINAIPNGTGTVSRFIVNNSSDVANASFLSLGAESTQTILISGISGTGTYLPLTMYTGGSERLRIDTSGNVGIGNSSPLKRLDINAAGSNAAIRLKETASYGVSWDIDVGSSNAMTFTNNAGSPLSYIFSNGNVGIGTTSPAYPLDVVSNSVSAVGISLRGQASNVGIASFWSNDGATRYSQLRSASDEFRIQAISSIPVTIYTNNTERMRIDSSGNLGVGITSPAARFQAKGSGATSATYCASFINSGDFALFDIRNDGLISTGTRTTSPYNNTTASAANMFVAGDGILYRSTSSLKYKTDVEDATHGLAEVLKLRAVTYKGKNDGDTVFGGLIAEEVDEAGLTEFVQYAEDGTPDALAYGQMVSLAFKAIQEQQIMIEELKAKVAALEAN